MNLPIIQPISNYNNITTNYVGNGLSNSVANNMPNGLVRISEPQHNKNTANNLRNADLRQIYTAKLAPSIGSMTESFLKSRSNSSPIFRFNEAATRYEMTSVAPIFPKQIKKNVDLII